MERNKTGMNFTVGVQFSSLAQSCLSLCDPMNHNMPGLPVHHQLPEFTQTHAHRVGDAIQPSHPLSFPSPPVPNPFSIGDTMMNWCFSVYIGRHVVWMYIHICLNSVYWEGPEINTPWKMSSLSIQILVSKYS